MKILYYGIFDGYSWRAEYAMAQGLRNIGHVLHCSNYSVEENITKSWEICKNDVDLVFIQYGMLFNEKYLNLFENVPVAFFASEAQLCDSIHLLNAERKPDIVIAHSMETFNYCKEKGIPVVRVHNAFNENLYFNIKSQYIFDVCFICSPSEKRLKVYRNLKDKNIRFFAATLKNAAEVNKIYNQSKIVLHSHMINKPYFPTRLFEVMPTQGCLLIEDMQTDYDDSVGKDFFETFSNDDEVWEKVQMLLENDEYRLKLVDNANKIASLNTWAKRMEEYDIIFQKLIKEYTKYSKKIKPKILIGCPVKQSPKILKEFLISLSELEKNDYVLDFLFIDDNHEDESKKLLENFVNESGKVIVIQEKSNDTYLKNDYTHKWDISLTNKVGNFKNRIINYSIQNNYDYLFLADSDLVLHPKTLTYLVNANKDIISEIFWTRWKPEEEEMPNVWMCDNYTFIKPERLFQIENDEQFHKESIEGIRQFKEPGIFEVGGLGACTLITKRALEKGVSFEKIKNISFLGEDRHFCVRATVLGVKLFVDTNCPPLHIYRDSILDSVAKFKETFKNSQVKFN